MLTGWEMDFLSGHRVARLATTDGTGQPHLVPIVFAFDGRRLFTLVDEKPKRVNARQLRRVLDIQVHSRVAVLVDDYSDDWDRLAWLQIRGEASILEAGSLYDAGLALLREKYPQYREMRLEGRPLIRIEPKQARSWRASPPGSGGV